MVVYEKCSVRIVYPRHDYICYKTIFRPIRSAPAGCCFTTNSCCTILSTFIGGSWHNSTLIRLLRSLSRVMASLRAVHWASIAFFIRPVHLCSCEISSLTLWRWDCSLFLASWISLMRELKLLLTALN